MKENKILIFLSLFSVGSLLVISVYYIALPRKYICSDEDMVFAHLGNSKKKVETVYNMSLMMLCSTNNLMYHCNLC